MITWNTVGAKFNIWFPTIIIGGLGLVMFYFYLFPTIPAQGDLVLIKGTIRSTSIIDDKWIYLYEFNNSFRDSYLKRKQFRQLFVRGDSIAVHIRKKDYNKLNNGSDIKLWSMKLNRKTYYTAAQEIKKQTFAKTYILPIFALICIVLAPLIYKYQVKRYKKTSAQELL